jgi:hypothetical protein
MHICHEEILMLLALVPGLRLVVMKLRAWWHRKAGCAHGLAHEEHDLEGTLSNGNEARP